MNDSFHVMYFGGEHYFMPGESMALTLKLCKLGYCIVYSAEWLKGMPITEENTEARKQRMRARMISQQGRDTTKAEVKFRSFSGSLYGLKLIMLIITLSSRFASSHGYFAHGE